MRKVLFTVLIPLACMLTANATIHTVQVSNFQFTPAIIPNVFVGDTIRWVWVNGGHTTTCDQNQDPSTFKPAGAATWSGNIHSGSTSFQYKVTVAGSYHYVCLPHSPDMAGSFTASTVTPVKLASFLVAGTREKVSLNWKTVNEQNVDFYSVRRSANGSTFTEIAQIPAVGNASSTENYSFSDTKISSDQKYYYYSLSIVDRDGKRTYSETKMFKNTAAATKMILTLSPNPVSKPGHLMMTFNAEKEGKMEVRVVSPEGKTIVNTSMQAYPGVNNGHVHLGELPSATYSLICVMNGIKETHKLVYK